MEALRSGRFSPLKPVPIIGFWEENGEFYFEMPFLDYESGFTSNEHDRVKKAIIESLVSRSHVKSSGFKKIILRELERLERAKEIDLIFDRLKKCSDEYIEGPTHGDLGLANILVGPEIYLIDFTPSFIQSPLMDIATLETSLIGAEDGAKFKKFFKEIERKFRAYKDQKDIIRMVKVLSYQSRIRDELFHGID